MRNVFLILLFMTAVSALAQTSPGYNSHSFQYLTGVLTPSSNSVSFGSGTWNSAAPPKYFSMSVTGAASAFQVVLEGSLDNLSWSNISVTTAASGMVSNSSPVPSLYFRLRAKVIAATDQITATAIGTW